MPFLTRDTVPSTDVLSIFAKVFGYFYKEQKSFVPV